jgi:hypothetical protein
MGRTGRTRGSVLKTIVVVVLVLAVVSPVIGYVTIASFRARVDLLISDLTLDFTLSQHPTQNALDTDATSFWLADPSRGVPTLTVSFKETEELAGVVFHSGAGTGADYRTYARPRLVELRFGGEAPVSYELKDTPAPQTECLDAIHPVLAFEIRVLSVYPAEPTGQELVAVRRVEFRSLNCP